VKAAAVLIATCAGARAWAGGIGPTSRETIGISLSVAPRIDVRGIGDIEIAETDSFVRTEAVCVSASTATRGYGVSLLTSSDATGPESAMPTPRRRFLIEWAGDPGQDRGIRIPNGATVMGFAAPMNGCSAQSAANARLIIRSLPQRGDLPAAAATLLIVPE
jgi:hypothetical protein